MSDSIREQLIQTIATKLSEIKILNGYQTDLGKKYTRRGQVSYNEEEQPSIGIFPGEETAEKIYSGRENIMPVTIMGNKLFAPTTENSSTVAEKLLADIISCILGPTFTIAFTNGKNQISQGDQITGATFTTTAYILNVTVSSGAWATNNAAGTILVRDVQGEFLSSENIKVGGIVAATLSGSQSIQTQYGGLANKIEYVSGGPANYPDAGETLISVKVVFNFHYLTSHNNPYTI